jgi:2-hydroxycyclohexanecarboxyl-CoA dehydrogenase
VEIIIRRKNEFVKLTALPAAVITGATTARGIGRAVADRLAARGHPVALLGRNQAAAAAFAEEISGKYGVPAIGAHCDVTDFASVSASIDEVQEHLNLPGVLVNNAGITEPAKLSEISTGGWENMLRVNSTGVFNMIRCLMPGMVDRGFGRIVTISSVSAHNGGGVFGGAHYAAAKSAVEGLTRAVSRECAFAGVTANSVAPGIIDTDIRGDAVEPRRYAEIISGIPVGRLGTVDEVAATVAFLCSAEAGYITGATIDVNGGLHLR